MIGVMGINYEPLKIELVKRNMRMKDLQRMVKFSTTTIVKLSKNKPVNLSVIERICKALELPVERVLRIE